MTTQRFVLRLLARRFFQVSGSLLLVGGVAAGARYAVNVRNPEVHVPAVPPMPAVNAFDDYRRAGELVRPDQAEIRRFRDSAASLGWDSAAAGGASPAPSGPEVDALLARHEETLALVRRGLQKPCQMPAVRDYDTLMPYAADFRTLAMLMGMEARRKRERGDLAGAARGYADIVRFGAEISRGGPLIGHLVSYAVGSMGRAGLWEALPHLNGDEAKLVAARLEEAASRQSPIVEAFEEEKAGGLNWLRLIFTDPDRAFTGFMTGDASTYGMKRALPAIYLRWSKREILDNYTRYLDGVIAQARLPYRKDAATDQMPPDADPLTETLCPVFAQAHFQYARHRADHALLATEAACHAYYVEKKRGPARLSNLVTAGYLKPVPEDPFGAGNPVRLSAGPGDRYVVYSVGPDGKEDDGEAIDNALLPPPLRTTGAKERRAVYPESVGDMAAGVNH